MAKLTKLDPEKFSKKQKERLSFMSRNVIGQDKALASIMDTVAIAEANLSDRSRPAGIFLLLGPTGTGKTHMVEKLAQVLVPTEDVIAIGVRFPEAEPSTFKQQLLALKPGDTIVASQLAGDFTLPKYKSNGKNKKLVLVAGGIGITPFYSIIKNTIDRLAVQVES